MGFAKNHMIDVEDRGWEDVEEMICLEHIVDPYLREQVAPASGHVCSFCGREDDSGDFFTVELQSVMELFMSGFWQFYGRYDQSPSFDGEALETEFTDYAVQEVGEGAFTPDVEEKVFETITKAITDIEVSTWDPQMSTTSLALRWEQFERITRFGSRFILTGRRLSDRPCPACSISWTSS